jgi:hypothetical protein
VSLQVWGPLPQQRAQRSFFASSTTSSTFTTSTTPAPAPPPPTGGSSAGVGLQLQALGYAVGPGVLRGLLQHSARAALLLPLPMERALRWLLPVGNTLTAQVEQQVGQVRGRDGVLCTTRCGAALSWMQDMHTLISASTDTGIWSPGTLC